MSELLSSTKSKRSFIDINRAVELKAVLAGGEQVLLRRLRSGEDIEIASENNRRPGRQDFASIDPQSGIVGSALLIGRALTGFESYPHSTEDRGIVVRFDVGVVFRKSGIHCDRAHRYAIKFC